ncbi:hypothetical protein RSAG8_00655, partial [Rhizoctonia solani AG-8 WAC10335]
MANINVSSSKRCGRVGLAEKEEILGVRTLRARSAAYGREKDAGA